MVLLLSIVASSRSRVKLLTLTYLLCSVTSLKASTKTWMGETQAFATKKLKANANINRVDKEESFLEIHSQKWIFEMPLNFLKCIVCVVPICCPDIWSCRKSRGRRTIHEVEEQVPPTLQILHHHCTAYQINPQSSHPVTTWAERWKPSWMFWIESCYVKSKKHVFTSPMAADRERSEWVWRAATVSSLEQFIHRSPTCRMRDSRKKTCGDGNE